jgi:hypothetical protein
MYRKQTHYDVLEVPRGAKREEIMAAYQRLSRELQQESALPDADREARVQEAYQVLSDPHRRTFYDASLGKKKPAAAASPNVRTQRWIGGIGAGLVLLIAAIYFATRGPSGPAPLSPEEIVAAISRSVGQVQAIEMSGRASPVGIAFADDAGSMVTACPTVAPGAQLVVRLGPRAAPALMSLADEVLGICKLAVAGAGSWPLNITSLEPRAGDRIYIARIGGNGDVTVAAGTIKGMADSAQGKVMQLSIPVAAIEAGSPVLDVQGRVIGIAAPPAIARPARWIKDARARRR